MDYKEKYEQAIKRAKAMIKVANNQEETYNSVITIFPELKESEDERMVKFIKNQLFNIKKTITDNYKLDKELTKAIDWLEKQGEQKHIEEYNITGIKSKHAEGKLGEMIKNLKPTDNIEPKFKQGDVIKEKETGNLFYVISIEDFGYTLHYKNCIAKGCTMDFKYEDNYELVGHIS